MKPRFLAVITGGEIAYIRLMDESYSNWMLIWVFLLINY